MTSVVRPSRRRVDGGGQPRRARPEHDDVEGLLIDLGAQAELVGDLRDGRAPQDVVGANQNRAPRGPMPSRSSSAWLSASLSMSCQLNGTRLRSSSSRIAKASPDERLPISSS